MKSGVVSVTFRKKTPRVRYALLEFVKDDSDEIFIQDSATLNSLINE